MTRAISLILALALCLTLCACGGGNETPETEASTEGAQVSTTETTQPPTDTTEPTAITAETLAGNYKSRLWFLDHTITLNANTTYSFGDNEKGTFQLGENYVKLHSKDDSYGFNDKIFTVTDNCIYYASEYWRFDEDDEYGLVFTPDANGFTDQSFESCVINGDLPGCEYTWLYLDLNADGTFTLKLGIREMTSLDVLETCEGTYTSNDTHLILNYNDQEYPLILSNENHIYFVVYDKT